MTASEPLILFTREGCHLCDLVAGMIDRAGLAWRPVDVDGDDGLSEKYGLQVPVVRHPGSGRELQFPFDEDRLTRFLAENA